jgi:hypothetical protein
MPRPPGRLNHARFSSLPDAGRKIALYRILFAFVKKNRQRLESIRACSSFRAMTRIPLTVKIGAEERVALQNLSKIEGRPLNELLREAIWDYLSRRNLNNLEVSTSALRTYRKQNPGFKNAIDEFVDAEAGFEDPLEGELIESQSGARRSAGPVQRKIRRILDS